MSRSVRVTLTEPQVSAVLHAIGEITAGDTSEWPPPAYRALLNAETRLAEAPAVMSEPVPELAGLAEVADLASEHYGRAITRKRAWQLTKLPAFPAPVQVLAAGPVWLEDDVKAFLAVPRPAGRKRANPDGEAV